MRNKTDWLQLLIRHRLAQPERSDYSGLRITRRCSASSSWWKNWISENAGFFLREQTNHRNNEKEALLLMAANSWFGTTLTTVFLKIDTVRPWIATHCKKELLNMRYPAGSIRLHPLWDMSILQTVLRAQYVSKKQLFRHELVLGNEERSTHFDRRLRRLAAHEYIVNVGTHHQFRNVYTIGEKAEEILVSQGEVYTRESHQKTSEQRKKEAYHWLALNEVNLLFRENGLIINWISETEIRTVNECRPVRYAKDYDGILEMGFPFEGFKIAIELEIWAKTKSRYKDLARVLSQEKQVHAVLYVVPSMHLVDLTRLVFSQTTLPVYVVLQGELHRSLLESQAWRAGRSPVPSTLRRLLANEALNQRNVLS